MAHDACNRRFDDGIEQKFQRAGSMFSEKSKFGGAAYVLTLFVGVSHPVVGHTAEPIVLGYIERAWIEPLSLPLDAKLDTGADTSSLSAIEITEYQVDGKDWVSFIVPLSEDEPDLTHQIKTPIIRTAKIRRAGTTAQSRQVVRLSVCVGGLTTETEFTLVDRRRMTYPVLLGRRFLANRVLVDSSLSHGATKACR